MGDEKPVTSARPPRRSLPKKRVPFVRGQHSPLRSECPQSIVVRNRLALGVQRLNTYVTGAGIEMRLDAVLDCCLRSPSHHSVQKPIAATALQIVVSETDALPAIPIVC